MVIALVLFWQPCLNATGQRPQFGVRGQRAGASLTITWVQPAGLAWDAGIRPGDRVVSLTGNAVESLDGPTALAGARALVVRSPEGRLATVSDVASPVLGSEQQRLAFLALAACFVMVGGAVFVLSTDTVVPCLILALAVVTAVMLGAGIATAYGAAWALAIEFGAVTCFGAVALLLFLAFPVNRLCTPAGRWVAVSGLVVTLALLAMYGWVVRVAPSAYTLLRPLGLTALAVELALASGLAIVAWVRPSPERRHARASLALVAAGAVAGLAPFGVLVAVPSALGDGYLLPPEVAILSVVVLPLSLAVAVLGHRLLGIERVVRRGLVALAVWIALLGCYAIGIDALGRDVSAWPAPLAAALGSTLLRVALVATTFPLLQHGLRRTLERWLFHDVYRYAPTLQQFSAEIAGLQGVGAIAAHVLDRVGQTLDLSWAALAVGTDPPVDVYRWADCPADGDLLALLNRDVVDQHPASARRQGQGSEWVPLVAEGAAIGGFVTGPKRHDVELQPEDRALLATLAPLVATALRNATLIEQLEVQVAALHEREQALAALSGQLLGAQEEERKRVALDIHDDPLARVTLLIRDLDEMVAQPRAERCRRAAEGIDEALRAICDDLHPPELDDVGLPAGLEGLASGVRVRSDLRAVLEVETTDGRYFGRLDRGLETALYRAAQEALNNCLKHARASEVTVTLRRDGGRIRLRVADNGRGCDPPARTQGAQKGLGLLGMRERLRPWAAVLDVEPNRPHGTIVSVEVALGDDYGTAE